MKCETGERCAKVADYIIRTGSTVREAASRFGISKSTVHKDVTDKLSRIDPTLYRAVEAVLQRNKAERHIRGGEATRNKYLKLHEDAEST